MSSHNFHVKQEKKFKKRERNPVVLVLWKVTTKTGEVCFQSRYKSHWI